MALTKISTGGVKDDTADEAKLKVSNAGSNGQFLSKQSGNTGGLTWADANSYTHPNHSGEVTSTADGAQVIADNIVDEANLKVDNTPTNDHVLTAKSSASGGLTWAAIPSSDPEVSIVASGSISTGQVVHLKSDGKVQVPTAVAQSTTDTKVDGNNYHYNAVGYYDQRNDRIFVAYRDTNNYGSGVVGTISGTSISFGTPVVFNSQNTYQLAAGFSKHAGIGVVAYDDQSGDKIRAKAVKIDGTTPSYHSNLEVYGDKDAVPQAVDLGDDHVNGLIVIKSPTTSNNLWGRKVTMGTYASPSVALGSGTSLAEISGSAGAWGGATTAKQGAGDQARHIVCWYKTGSSATELYHRGFRCIGDDAQTATAIHTIDSCRCTGVSVAYDSIKGKYLIVYNDVTNSKVRSMVVAPSVSGYTLTLTNGTAANVSTGTAHAVGSRSLEYNPDTNKFVWQYPTSSGAKKRYATLVDTNSVTWSAEESANTDAANTGSVIALYDTTSNQEIYGWYGSANSSRWGITTPDSSTINTANYLGVSSGNYSDGDTAVIKLSGSTVASSSLTPGSQIYSSDTGALSQTAGTTSVVVGKALSATSVLITE